MTDGSIPFERLVFGHDEWRSHRAINEIEIYCELMEYLEGRIDVLATPGAAEELTLRNVQTVISSYAIEIAMKSFWALDHPDESVPHIHNLVKIFDGLKDETVKSLAGLQLTRKVLQDKPTPFTSNRYSMEHGSRDISVYPAPFLRDVTQLLSDKLRESKESLFKPPKSSTA